MTFSQWNVDGIRSGLAVPNCVNFVEVVVDVVVNFESKMDAFTKDKLLEAFRSTPKVSKRSFDRSIRSKL